MNRREFSALLPMLFAAPALTATTEAQTTSSQAAVAHAPLSQLQSGQYPWGEGSGPSKTGRTSRHFVLGMLPDNIRLESHATVLAPGAPMEPINHHKHSEIWFIREGTVTLMTASITRTLKAGDMGLCVAGDEHSVGNASKTDQASYFVVTVGPPE